MQNTTEVMQQMYAAFNRRDINSVLARMSDGIDWPKASEGGRVIGKDAIRAYWTRQWAEFDPTVVALQVIDKPGGQTDVRVHQLVKSLGGDVLSDLELWHTYTIRDGLIEHMDIRTEDGDSGFGAGH